ncbi:unnamed protein product [Laminaria digitata]
MSTCRSTRARVEVVEFLLEAGANPAVANENGFTAFHMAATDGRTDLVDILLSKARATLNRCASDGQTPFLLACNNGHESMVTKLLLIGAMQPTSRIENRRCPLDSAVFKGFAGVLRLLISEGVT